jgi:hypothetical protein
MPVEVGSEMAVEKWDQALESCSAHEPLEIGSSGVVIWTVETRSGDDLQ